jgi:hypothetical protein
VKNLKINCSCCGYEYEKKDMKKCPRCGKMIFESLGCANCKGCSFWNKEQKISCKDDENAG